MRKDGVAWIAVQNFVGSMDCSLPIDVHLMNAAHDCWLYSWNEATTRALLNAIHDTYDILNTLKEA